MKKYMVISIILVVLILLFFVYKNTQTKALGADGMVLHKCPSSPNCISSDKTEDKLHYYPAFEMDKIGFSQLEQVLEQTSNIKIKYSQNNYIHAVASTNIGFKDDLEFLFIESEQHCLVRSLSRLGHKDFGVNKKRMDEIKRSLK